ncbi:hypothetical protein [Streptomyces sp. NPDC056405]|uniref:hypothetical protein n=1 Tax=Streptomyces sp. NPDC056405 TaxID=3345811 RepID=UPI0035DE71B9
MALEAEAVLQEVPGRLVQSLHDEGTVVDLNGADRPEGARLAGDVRQVRLGPSRLHKSTCSGGQMSHNSGTP